MGVPGPYGGIVLTSLEWFEECVARGCRVFHFPPGRKPRVNKLY